MDNNEYSKFAVSISSDAEIQIIAAANDIRQREKQKLDSNSTGFAQYSQQDLDIFRDELQLKECYQKEFNLDELPDLLMKPFHFLDKEEAQSQLIGICPDQFHFHVLDERKAQSKDTLVLPSEKPTDADAQNDERSLFPAPASILPPQLSYPSLCNSGQTSAASPDSSPRWHLYHPPQVPTAMELEEELLRHVSLRKIGERIYCWNGSYYHCVNSTELRELILSQLRSSLAIKGSSSQLGEIETLLRSDSRISGAPLDKEATVLNVQNGILNLQNLLLQPQDPAYFFTSVISVPWHPDAACPRFDAFLCDVAGGNPELIRRFWQAIGYILVPDNHAKRFIYLWGAGNSGKSVLGGLLESFFPETLTSGISIFQLGDRFSLSNLVDKRINVSMDLPNRCLNEQAVGAIKMITGGDSILVEEKYKAPYTTHVNCKLIFGSNFPLRLAAADQAFLDRCLELPFCYSVPKGRQNPHLLESLKAERPGILAKAINAYLHLRQNNYAFPLDGQMPSACVEVEAQVSEVPVEEFVPACCEIAPEAVTSSEALYVGYCSFCARINRPPMGTQAAFSAALRLFLEQACPSVTKKKVRIQGTPVQAYCGIRLRADCV